MNVLVTGAGEGYAFEAGAAANTLDDYEEETWTSVLTPGSGTITMASQAMTYTKIGRTVTLCGLMGTTGDGSAGGNLTISGLPFKMVDPLQNLMIKLAITTHRIKNLTFVF